MFPNLPDSFAKMIVYIGVALIAIAGYFYIHNLDKVERITDQLSEQKIEYAHAIHEDSFAVDVARKSLIDAESLAFLLKNPGVNFKEIIKDGDLREPVYIQLLRTKFNADSAAKIFQHVVNSMRDDFKELTKYGMLSKSLKAKIEANEKKIRVVNEKNKAFLFLGFTGLPLLILGLVRWQRTDSKTNGLLDVQIELKKLELANERRKQSP